MISTQHLSDKSFAPTASIFYKVASMLLTTCDSQWKAPGTARAAADRQRPQTTRSDSDAIWSLKSMKTNQAFEDKCPPATARYNPAARSDIEATAPRSQATALYSQSLARYVETMGHYTRAAARYIEATGSYIQAILRYSETIGPDIEAIAPRIRTIVCYTAATTPSAA